jgi:HSP20 family protein
MRLVRYTYPSFRTLSPLAFQRSPWSGFETEVDRLFNSAFADFAGNNAASNRTNVDLYEDKENTYVRAELPGVNRDAINVEITDGTLTLTATRKVAAANGGEAETTRTFTRTVTVGDDVQADKVSAAYENGVLTVTLPKREEVKPKKITVAVK